LKRIDQVLNAVCRERERQNALWGNQNGNHPFEWMSILGEEVGELCEAVNETFFQNPKNRRRGGRENIYREAVQVAAVSVAIAEEILQLEDYQHGFCCIFDGSGEPRRASAHTEECDT
jgi:NTP pyrophosphatase (non-canonical NTP hydrolase)